ncbi:MAG: hypothetical protein ACQEQ4_05080, partial [Fibrobacterota bacterium]
YDEDSESQIFTITVEDETLVDHVRWSIDETWRTWYEEDTPVDDISDGEKIFECAVSKSLAESMNADKIWLMGTDASGNSVVLERPLAFRNPMGIDSVFARDTEGDGMADQITARFSPGSNTDLAYEDLAYAWPENAPRLTGGTIDVRPADNEIIIDNPADLTGGYYDGATFWFDYILEWGSGDNADSEEISLDAPILDRVGPAVQRTPQPTYRMPANDTQNDTLVLEFSEPIAALSTGEAHLSFKDTDGNTENITTREVTENNGEYTFIFDYQSIMPYDSVRIYPEGPLRDQADEPNRAEDYNLWRPIKSIGDNDPEFIYAYHQDSEGDGMGNQIYYLFEIAAGNDPFDHTHITDITYNIDGQNETVQPGDADVAIQEQNDTVLIIIDTDDISGEALGQATLFFDNQGETAELTGDIDDRTGPAVEDGTDLPLYTIPDMSEDNQVDTFQLAFTEPVTGVEPQQPVLAFKGDGIDSTTLEAIEISENGGVYTVFFAAESLTDFTHVKINRESDLRDRAADPNAAEEYNDWIPFDREGNNEPEFLHAFIEDDIGDGRGNRIVKRFAVSSNGAAPFTEEHITEVNYFVNGVDETLPRDQLDISRSGNDVTIAFSAGAFPGDATGQGIIYFEKPDGATHRLATNITDDVGPAVEEDNNLPLYRIPDPRQNNQVDTFQVAFTEAVDALGENGTYLAFRGNPGDSVALAADEISIENDVFSFFFSPRSLENFSEVKIVHESDLRDMANNQNPAAEYNNWVPFDRQGNNDPEFIEGYLKDSRGDGRGDGIIYLFEISRGGDNPFTEAHITEVNYSVNGTEETLPIENIDISRDDYRVKITIDGVDFDGDAAGSGYIGFSKNGETFQLPTNIEDRVGPALTDAVCLQQDENRDRDTLIFDVSEALANDISAKGTYFYLYKGAEDGPQEALSVAEFSHVENTEYRAVTDKNIIEHGDWIHFIHDSGIEDPRANPPLDINQKIEIDVRGGIVPAITEANLFDTRGDQAGRLDGHGDSLAVELRLSEDPRALTADDIVEVGLSWSGSDYTYTSVDVDADNRFFIRDNSITGGAAGDNSQITIVFKDEKGTLHERTTAVNDRIAPVIRSAAYERRESGDDILDVIFSEDLGSTGSSSPFDVDRAILPEVRLISHSGANAVYAIPQNADPLEFGDSLWIRGGEDIGDSDANEQVRDDNERVEISYRRVTELSGAYYLDTDSRPDGYIDEVILTFDTPLPDDISLSEDKIFLPGHRAFTIASAQNRGADHIVVAVAQDESEVSPQTVVTSEDILSIEKTDISDTLMIGTREGVQIADSLAPVAVRAVFMPVDDQGQDRLIDTLRVHFSEPVESLDRDVPFELSSPHTGTYRLIYEDFADEGAVWKAAVDYDNNDHFPAHGDSLWVYENGDVRDEEGSVQNRNTVPVPLELGRFDPGFRVGITPNPFAMENFDEDSLYLRVVEGRRPIPQDLRVRMTILDQVGNLIADFSPGDIGPVENNMITFGFKPQNRAGRRLGRGSYYAQIRLSWTSGEGASQQARRDIMIGIQEDVGSEESQDNGDDEGGE